MSPAAAEHEGAMAEKTVEGKWKRPTSEAALLLLESLCGQPEQIKRFVGFVAYFQAPIGTVSEACDGVGDELRAHLRTLVPCGVMIC
jgi:hypothetical protein